MLISSCSHREGPLRVLALPELSAPEVEPIQLDGSGYILVYGIQGDFVRVDKGWILSVTDEELILSLAIPTLLRPSESVKQARANIRIRTEASPNATIAGIMDGAECDALLEGYDRLGDYLRVFLNTLSKPLLMGWILSSLMEPFNGDMYKMNPNQCTGDEGVTLMVHSAPGADAPCIERVGPEDEVCVVGSSGKWRRVLSNMGPMGWTLSESMANGIFAELLVPVCRDMSTLQQQRIVQQSATAEFPLQPVTASQSQQSPSESISSTNMEVVSMSKLRDEPAFVGLELAVLKKGTIVEIIEERGIAQKPGFPPQLWVRVRCTAGEGWTAMTNRNGPLLVPSSFCKQPTEVLSRNSTQQQHCQQSDDPLRPPGTSVLPIAPVPIHSAEGTSGGVPPYPRFMEVYAIAKLREEADFTGLELAVLQQGDVVEILGEREIPQKPGFPPQPWVNIRCIAGEGWIAKRNRNGPFLVPTTHKLQAGKAAPEKNREACGQITHDNFTRPQHIPPRHSPSPTTPTIHSSSTHLLAVSSSKFMEVVATAKLREDADFTGLELAVLGKGDVVEVLEERDVPQRPGCPPQPWVRVRCGTGEGWTAKTNRNGALLIPTQMPTVPLSGQKEQPQVESELQPLDDTAPSSQCSNSVRSPTIAAAAPSLNVLPPTDALPCSSKFFEIAVTTAKLREEPDFSGLELAVLEKGAIVEVFERKDIPQKPGRPPQPWVKVKSRFGEGWTALTNRNGPLLVPSGPNTVAGEQQKEKGQSDTSLLSSSSPISFTETSSVPKLNESLPSSQKEQQLRHLRLPAVSNTLLDATLLAARYDEQLRQYPTSESPVIALLRAGAMARVMEDKPCGSWVKVELIGEEQPMMGWIDSQTAAPSHPVSFKWIR